MHLELDMKHLAELLVIFWAEKDMVEREGWRRESNFWRDILAGQDSLSETGHVGRGGDYQVRTLVDIILKQNIH